MIRLFLRGVSLVTALVLGCLIMAAGSVGARADDGDPGGAINSGGDIAVRVVDPSDSASPTSGEIGGPGSPTSGRGNSTGSGTSNGTSGSAPGGGTTANSPSAGIPRWIIVSGFDNAVRPEVDPFRGWVRSTVTVANRSTTETLKGVLVFRVRSFLGGQIGPSVTRQITALRPGRTYSTTVDLVGVGQWPLVQSSVSFQPSGPGQSKPIVREAWVLGFPWVLIVIAIAAAAALAIVRIRRGAPVILQPEPAI